MLVQEICVCAGKIEFLEQLFLHGATMLRLLNFLFEIFE